MDYLHSFLELIKYILPALVVYFLMRQFFRGHVATEQMKIRASMKSEDKALRVQAYERLTLFCERMNISSLLMRLNSSEMNTTHLKNALLIAIQKEFEHNLTQQIYISSELWQMITLLKDNTMASITQNFVDHGQGDKAEFETALLNIGRSIELTMSAKVKDAIRKEVELYFQ